MKKRELAIRRRLLRMEPLEAREMLAADWYQFTPLPSMTGEETEIWDLTNRMRVAPQDELYHLFSDLQTLTAWDSRVNDALQEYCLGDDPVANQEFIDSFIATWRALSSAEPLAISQTLTSSASSHNLVMKTYEQPTHQVTVRDDQGNITYQEPNLADRLTAAGFVAEEDSGVAENILAQGKAAEAGYSVAYYVYAAFVVDWGVNDLSHRENLMNSDYSEMGIDLIGLPRDNCLNPYLATVDYGSGDNALQNDLGSRTDGGYLLGCVYTDKNGDGYYTTGEGISNATITISPSNSDEKTVISNQLANGVSVAGGYQIFLLNGTYDVTVSGGSFGDGWTRTVTIEDGLNEKLDFRVEDVDRVAPTLDLNGADETGTGWTAIFTESGGAVGVISDLATIVDPSNSLRRMTLTFDIRPDGIAEILQATPTGYLRVSTNPLTGDVTVYGNGTVEDYLTVLRSLTYGNNSDFCDASARTVRVSVYNGLFWSDEAILTIGVQLTNLPFVSLEDAEVWEGDDGQKIMTFNVVLDSAARTDIFFNWRLEDGNAAAGINYVANAGQVKISVGETSGSIDVYIIGNYDAESNLTFSLVADPESLVGVYGDRLSATGTIKDDDTPIPLGTVVQWSDPTAKTLERGERRYLYSFSPEDDGLVRWSANGSGALKVTVYETTHAGPVLTTSEWVEGTQIAEWYAKKDMVYIVKITGPYSVRQQSLSLLTLNQAANGLLVDPLLAADGSLNIRWEDGDFIFGEGDNQWTLPSDIWKDASLFSLFTEDPDASIQFFLPSGENVSYDAESHSIFIQDEWLSIEGFGSVTFTGSEAADNLHLTGSSGNDFLYYSGGSGYLTVHRDTSPTTVFFQNVAEASFSGANGGNDIAVCENTDLSNTVRFQAGSVDCRGGGSTATISDFSEVSVRSASSGTDVLLIENNSNADLLLQTMVALMSGEANGHSYQYLASDFKSISVNATGSTGRIVVSGSSDSSSYYWTTFGYLKAEDSRLKATLEVVNATHLRLNGLVAENKENLRVLETNVPFVTEVDTEGESILYEGTNGQTLTLPSWSTPLSNPTAASAEAEKTVLSTKIEADETASAVDEAMAALLPNLLADSTEEEKVEENAMVTAAFSPADFFFDASSANILGENSGDFWENDASNSGERADSTTVDSPRGSNVANPSVLFFSNDDFLRRRKRGFLY